MLVHDQFSHITIHEIVVSRSIGEERHLIACSCPSDTMCFVSRGALLFALGGLAVAQEAANCGILGPAYPIPAKLSSLDAIKEEQTRFEAMFAQIINGTATDWGPIGLENSSFSVGVFAANEEGYLFEHHHLAPGHAASLTGGELNADTIYRIASVTKLLTVYTILTQLGTRYWEEPVTKFVPELANALESDVRWSEITLGALAAQLSGVARDCWSTPTLKGFRTDPEARHAWGAERSTSRRTCRDWAPAAKRL
jgi:CubicO group peptidase (beta-lactamase class C family)